MGAYDSIYARCNCDWPDDDRCKNLPDDQTRWFNHLLWIESVRQKSSVLPQRCDAAYWAKRLGATIERVEEMIKAMATEDLLAWTEFGELVIFGTRKNHPKLSWKQEEPEETVNPFRKTSGWRFLRLSGDSSGYPVKQGGYPVKSPTVESRVEKSRVKERREENIPAVAGGTVLPPLEADPLEEYPDLKAVYPEIRTLIVQAHPRAKLPEPGTSKELEDRKVLSNLVRLDGHTQVEVVKVTKWVLSEEIPNNGFSWRDQFQSIGGLRNRKSGDTLTKFAKMCESYTRAMERPAYRNGNASNGRLDLGPITPEQKAMNDEVYASIRPEQQRARAEKRRLAAEAAAAEGATT